MCCNIVLTILVIVLVIILIRFIKNKERESKPYNNHTTFEQFNNRNTSSCKKNHNKKFYDLQKLSYPEYKFIENANLLHFGENNIISHKNLLNIFILLANLNVKDLLLFRKFFLFKFEYNNRIGVFKKNNNIGYYFENEELKFKREKLYDFINHCVVQIDIYSQKFRHICLSDLLEIFASFIHFLSFTKDHMIYLKKKINEKKLIFDLLQKNYYNCIFLTNLNKFSNSEVNFTSMKIEFTYLIYYLFSLQLSNKQK